MIPLAVAGSVQFTVTDVEEEASAAMLSGAEGAEIETYSRTFTSL